VGDNRGCIHVLHFTKADQILIVIISSNKLLQQVVLSEVLVKTYHQI